MMKNRRWIAAAVGVVLAISLAACSSTPQITSGKIIAKRDLPATSGVIPVITYVSSGSITIPITNLVPYSNPEEWQIELSNKRQEGWLDVGPSFYYSAAADIGKHFGGPTGKPNPNRVGGDGIQQPDPGSS